MDADKLNAYLEVSERQITLAEARNDFSRIIEDVHNGKPPVIISVYNKPQAVISSVAEYHDLLARAEAYDALMAHHEAEAQPKLSFDEVAKRMREYASRRKAERRTTMQIEAALGGRATPASQRVGTHRPRSRV